MLQLALDLHMAPSLAEEDFFVTAANRDAYALLTAWPEWPARVMLLTGPAGSGKTHLSAIWAERAGARVMEAEVLQAEEAPKPVAVTEQFSFDLGPSETQPSWPDLIRPSILNRSSLLNMDPRIKPGDDGGGEIGDLFSHHDALVVENIDAPDVSERALFHLLNAAREAKGWLLLTAQNPLSPQLADLASRLRALPHVSVSAPDDELLRVVLVKQLTDRQLIVDEGVVDYLVRRMERSLEAVRSVVDALDKESLARQRRVTRTMAADMLARSEEEPEQGET